jgi:hypothetical protein
MPSLRPSQVNPWAPNPAREEGRILAAYPELCVQHAEPEARARQNKRIAEVNRFLISGREAAK